MHIEDKLIFDINKALLLSEFLPINNTYNTEHVSFEFDKSKVIENKQKFQEIYHQTFENNKSTDFYVGEYTNKLPLRDLNDILDDLRIIKETASEFNIHPVIYKTMDDLFLSNGNLKTIIEYIDIKKSINMILNENAQIKDINEYENYLNTNNLFNIIKFDESNIKIEDNFKKIDPVELYIKLLLMNKKDYFNDINNMNTKTNVVTLDNVNFNEYYKINIENKEAYFFYRKNPTFHKLIDFSKTFLHQKGNKNVFISQDNRFHEDYLMSQYHENLLNKKPIDCLINSLVLSENVINSNTLLTLSNLNETKVKKSIGEYAKENELDPIEFYHSICNTIINRYTDYYKSKNNSDFCDIYFNENINEKVMSDYLESINDTINKYKATLTMSSIIINLNHFTQKIRSIADDKSRVIEHVMSHFIDDHESIKTMLKDSINKTIESLNNFNLKNQYIKDDHANLADIIQMKSKNEIAFLNFAVYYKITNSLIDLSLKRKSSYINFNHGIGNDNEIKSLIGKFNQLSDIFKEKDNDLPTYLNIKSIKIGNKEYSEHINARKVNNNDLFFKNMLYFRHLDQKLIEINNKWNTKINRYDAQERNVQINKLSKSTKVNEKDISIDENDFL